MLRRKSQFARVGLREIITLCFLFLSTGAHASVEWLLQQTQPDGSIVAAAALANPNQSTAEAAAALRLYGITTQVDAAEAYVRAFGYRGTEELSRLVLIGVARGESTSALTAELLSHQNADGGFGELPGYDSTALDTGYALYALYRAGQRQTTANLAAINYLMQTQAANGGWSVGPNLSSVYVSARATQALWQFRQLLPTSIPSANRARQFILDQRLADGSWESNFVSASALIALAPMQTAQDELAGSVAALNARRAANGSWDGDVFTTALAMQASLLAASANANPDLARVRARIVDGETSIALAGVAVRLVAAASQTRSSNAQGEFDFADLAAGSYSLVVEASGYPTVTSSLTLRAGQTLDLGVLRLLRNAAPTAARVEGIVRDESGAALSGASISVTGAGAVQTGADGRYAINEIAPGNVTISASRNGYFTAQGATTLVAGATVNFSPVLRSVATAGFSIFGTFRDAGTLAPLAGVSVEITGSAQATATSGADGAFDVPGLAPGNIRVAIQLAGYQTRTAFVSADGGQRLDVSAVLERVVAGAPETFAVSGRVTDSVSRAPLPGATVAIVGAGTASTTAGADGSYQLTGFVPGAFTITISASGYQPATASSTGLAYQNIEFSPALLPVGTQPTGLRAIVTDATTGDPIEGASVVITHAGGNTTTTTAPGGEFIARNIQAGPASVSISALGFQTAQLTLSPVAGYINDLGALTLLPTTYTAPVTLVGRVLSSTSNAALAGVNVIATTTAGTQVVQTAANGSFSVSVISGESAELEFVATNYVATRFALFVSPSDTDLGQVRLRPTGLDSLLADLATQSVDANLAVSTPTTYQVTGSVSARLQNRGYAAAPSSTVVIAFEDRNTNGAVDAGESEFGRVSLITELAPGESRDVVINVAGNASFRDAPITVLADAEATLVERDETNNAFTSIGACIALPPAASALAPALKWQWSGSPARPQDNAVFGPTMVGQFSDDNGDGRIDTRDVPDVVFTTVGQALTVVSGSNGQTIWQSAAGVVTAWGSPAIGDIDGDGLNEIVVSNPLRTQLLAFEHDGTLKWSAPNGPQHGDQTRDGITIANLDGVGLPEIITGHRVYSAAGQLLWTGNDTQGHGGTISYGTLPIAADIDGDGTTLEVVAGKTVFRANGTVLWTLPAAITDGFTSIGNFDADEFPEIVLVTQARLYVLEHTGAVKWGPITIPGAGGRGGAPTVGDFDGDGQPEIGVAGATQYTVFETDGSIKWQQPTSDVSSSFTGSSLFDFDGDGRIEVVYADEQFLRIYDGATGVERVRIANGSGTTLEYPVVADVDGDGRAELLVAANNGATLGVRAFEGSAGEWMPTRPIWNQHAYHIDNVNDDGTIPAVEAKGWRTHNSYRANSAIQRQAEPVADLTAGALRLVDNGIGQPASLILRVGNAGAALIGGTASVTFYDGAPPSGTVLGTVILPAIASGAFADVTLNGITTVSPNGTLFAVVDSTSRVTECDELNNTASTPGRPALGALDIATNQAQYAPGATAQVTATIRNTGRFTNSFRATLVVLDTAGNPIASLPGFNATSLVSGGSLPFTTPFATTGLLDGNYVIRGTLFDATDAVLTTTDRLFAIGHDATQGAAASLRVTADRAVYNTSDSVSLETLSRNLTTGMPFSATRVRLVVTNPANATVLDTTLPLGDLMPAAARQAQHILALVAAPEGNYSVAGTLENGTGQVLATGGDTFEVRGDAAIALTGTVTLSARTVEAGQSLMCTRTVRNGGTGTLTNLPLRYVVARLSDDTTVSDQQVTATILAGGSNSALNSIATTGFAAGDYACAVQARVNDTWRDLAYGLFTVTPASGPVVDIDATLTRGKRSKLLVLMDGKDGWPCTQMKDVELWAAFPRRLISSAQVKVELFNSSGTRLDRETIKLSNFHNTVDANSGSGANLRITGLSADVLTVDIRSSSQLGSGYRLVATVTMSNVPPMIVESNVMGESCGWRAGIEARFGDFEMSDGETANCNPPPTARVPSQPSLAAQRQFLETLLSQTGWAYTIVTEPTDFARELRSGAYAHYALFAEHLKLGDQVQLELDEAVFSGATLLDAGMHDTRHHSFDQALGIQPLGPRSNATSVTFNVSWMPASTANLLRTTTALKANTNGAQQIGKFNGTVTGNVAITQYTYGRGKSAYVGYDLLGEATYGGTDGLHARFLRNVLVELKPTQQPPRTGEVVSLELTLTNRAAATPGRARLPLPAGVQIIDAGGATIDNGALVWDFTLNVDDVRTRTALVRMPASAGPVTFEAVVSSGVAPNLTEQARPALTLEVNARATLAAAIALAYTNPDFNAAKNWLEAAQTWSASGNHANALASLVQAGYEACVVGTQANNLRWMIDDLIWQTGRLVP